MNLSKFADYSFRVLIYLGRCPDRQITISELAKNLQVSRNHLVKVVHKLGTDGFLESARGRNGGLRLAREPAHISLGSVIAATEDLALVECLRDQPAPCTLGMNCQLRRLLQVASQRLVAFLDEHTLADLLATTNEPGRATFILVPDGVRRSKLRETATKN